MKKLLCLLILSILVTPLSLAQEDGIEWELVSVDAISEHGETGSWNSVYNEPGAVIYHDGQYHLFINGYNGFPANTGIGYRVSSDGINYEWASEEPLFSRDDVIGDPVAIAATDVLILEDGTWVLYFYNFNSGNWPHVQGTIGRATADEPLGEWIIDDAPVLVAGDEGSFDEKGTTFASITETDDGFVMYYIGESGIGLESLGRATSVDGIVWEKDDEPVFELDPEQGEGISFVVNEVIFDGEQWIMAYKSQRAAIGFAFSEDGMTWERYADNPILKSNDVEGINSIGYISLMMNEDDEYYLFFEGNVGSKTQIYSAIATFPE